MSKKDSILLSLLIYIFWNGFIQLMISWPLEEHDSWLRELHINCCHSYRSKRLCKRNILTVDASFAAGLHLGLKTRLFGRV